MQMDDDRLMALADGEITGSEAEALHDRIAADPDLAERYALFVETAELARQAMQDLPEAQVSDALVARIRAMGAASAPPEASNVVPLRTAPAPAAPTRWQPMALAASLALAVGLGAGLMLSNGAETPVGAPFSTALTEHLDSLPSGNAAQLPDGTALTVVASFTDAAGQFCREYEAATPGRGGFVAVACREDAGWQLQFAMAQAGNAGAEAGYAPASALETLDAYFTATGAGQPMTPDQERGFLR
ncbi:conserved hypothetical protein [Roseovarius sp. EC-HK134]|uniref:Anti-sigma factor n=1 Tax=Roseovarius mucosus TaxID=215743 RepID=A0A1V0RS72_9RHOB|nr:MULTISPECIES: hypothetical protein [Roseovarius]ARE84619.1 hypothetical protein ROSMUCSMR3_03156 [Roseovarius mucosus]VVT20169.1 conserved hypothetical protein [Roseovarius sp. EC-SD190]VVT20292.1 conserved hypothetical protein [Roseovarius sp. EC-HK134]